MTSKLNLSDIKTSELKEMKKAINEELKKRSNSTNTSAKSSTNTNNTKTSNNSSKTSSDAKTDTQKKPAAYTREDMKTVLKRNGIEFKDAMKKEQLLEIVKKNNLVSKVKEYHNNKTKSN